MKILFDFELDNKYISRLEEEFSQLDFVSTDDKGKLQQEISDTDVLVDFRGVSLADIKRAKNLKWIQTWTAGVDKFTKGEFLQYLLNKDIILTNMSGVHSNIIAEHTLGFMINFSRRMCDFHEQKKKGVWERLQVGQLENRTLAVIGLGSIGSEIARRAKAFKMDVIGTKRNTEVDVEGVDKLYSPDELKTVLKQADYVVSMLPLTDDTVEMFGVEEFAVMKETAYFINMARGEVVDEPALIDALEKDEIAGAGLDVFAEEPLSSDSPFYKLDNVLMTPHVAGTFPEYNEKAIAILEKNLEEFSTGKREEMINKIDYDLGY